MEENREQAHVYLFFHDLPHGPGILRKKTRTRAPLPSARPMAMPAEPTGNAPERQKNTLPWWTSWTGRSGPSWTRCASWAWTSAPLSFSVPTTGMNFTTVRIKAAAAGPTATEASWTAPGNCWMFSAAAAAVPAPPTMDNLAGLKWTNHEGGIRVPLIISWPGNAAPDGKVCLQPVYHATWPLCWILAGIRMPEGKDAVSYMDTVRQLRQAARLCSRGSHRDHGDGWKRENKINRSSFT